MCFEKVQFKKETYQKVFLSHTSILLFFFSLHFFIFYFSSIFRIGIKYSIVFETMKFYLVTSSSLSSLSGITVCSFSMCFLFFQLVFTLYQSNIYHLNFSVLHKESNTICLQTITRSLLCLDFCSENQ